MNTVFDMMCNHFRCSSLYDKCSRFIGSYFDDQFKAYKDNSICLSGSCPRSKCNYCYHFSVCSRFNTIQPDPSRLYQIKGVKGDFVWLK